MKADIGGESIKFSNFKKKTRVNKLKEIESELKELCKKYDGSSNACELEKIERIEHEIRTIVEVENRGACIRDNAHRTLHDTTRRDNSRQENRVMCGSLRHDATRQDKNRASSRVI